MSKTHYINTPLNDDTIAKFKVGDRVLISGTVYTARDAAHKLMVESLKQGKPLPFDIAGQILYYTGPAPAPPGKPIGSAGPTTSYRMDAYTPILLNAGLKGMIGKGDRSKKVRDAIKKNKAIYFITIGGAAVYIAKSIKESKVIAYPELGAEAVYLLEVKEFPAIVGIDMYGGDIYEIGPLKYRMP